MVRSRGQLSRRTRELKEAKNLFVLQIQEYERKLRILGKEKLEAMEMAKNMHAELAAFESKHEALDKLLEELDDAKEANGFWRALKITELLERIKALVKGGTNG